MKDVVVKITPAEQMRIREILLDKDTARALELLKVLLDRIEASGKAHMQLPLDG
ncbi:MAG: hypothetical protein GXP25_06930 [Planctomycetes bacterium]|nr:hypothetical protein [Planctomycetota bacterium]